MGISSLSPISCNCEFFSLLRTRNIFLTRKRISTNLNIIQRPSEMKIFPLGFFVMALFNVIEAKQSDIGQEKETNKSQLDMLFAQIRQLQEEGAHQRIQTKEQELKNEELQLQLQQEIKER